MSRWEIQVIWEETKMIKIKKREKTRDRKLKRMIKMEKREKIASFKKKIACFVHTLDPWRLDIGLKKKKYIKPCS